MPRGIYNRKTKRKTRGPNRKVMYFYEGTLYSLEEIKEIADNGDIHSSDHIYECTGEFRVERGPVKLIPVKH